MQTAQSKSCWLAIIFTSFMTMTMTFAVGADKPTLIKFELYEHSPLRHLVGVLPEQPIFKQKFASVMENDQKLQFDLLQKNGYFRLDRNNGQLTIFSIIDRESLCANLVRTCCMKVGASETCSIDFTVQILSSASTSTGNQPTSHLIQIVVEILDRNDNPPRFAKPEYQFTLAEDARIGLTENLPVAKDADSKEFGLLGYKLASCAGEVIDNTFQLHQQTSLDGNDKVGLRLARELDRELRASYTYCIIAMDKGNPSNSGTLTVRVNVEDKNDHAPAWVEGQQFVVSVREGTPPFTKILQLRAVDKDPKFGELRYSIDSRDTDIENNNHFIINSETGQLQLQRFLDFETRDRYSIPVLVQDNGQLSATATVTVLVVDENDEKPRIQFTPSSQVRIQENKDGPQQLGIVVVHDGDSGANGRVNCKLQDQLRQDDDKFILRRAYTLEQKVFYELFANRTFDREYKNRYQLFVSCQDEGSPPNVEKQDIIVLIDDVNDHAPKFELSPLQVNFYEGNTPGQSIISIRATDADAGMNAQLEYFVEETARAFITIQRNSGHLSSAISFDREERDSYFFNITVRDLGTPPLETTLTLRLNILDINDNEPLFENKSYEFVVPENATLGSYVGQISATDKDLGSNGTVYYRLKFSDNSQHQRQPFSVNKTGHVHLIEQLDREMEAQYFLTAEAVDQGQPRRSTQVALSILVSDINDSAPRFKYTDRTRINVTCDNTAVNYILASTELLAEDKDTDPNYNNIRYNITHVYPRFGREANGETRHDFKIDEFSGQLFLTRVPQKQLCPRTEYLLTIVAYDPTKLDHTCRKHVEVYFQAGKRSTSSLFTSDGVRRSPNNKEKKDHTSFDDDTAYNNGGGPFRDHNLLIIISLICASIIIGIVLVMTIFMLRRRGVNFAYRKGSTVIVESNRHQTTSMDMTTNDKLKQIQRESTDCHEKENNMSSVVMSKSASSLDDIYFKHEFDKNYEKIKWSTYQKENTLQQSQSNHQILPAEEVDSVSKTDRTSSTNLRNTYQTLAVTAYNQQTSNLSDSDFSTEYNIGWQTEKKKKVGKSGESEMWLGTASRVRKEQPNNVALIPTGMQFSTANKSCINACTIDSIKRTEENKKSGPAKSSYFTISFV